MTTSAARGTDIDDLDTEDQVDESAIDEPDDAAVTETGEQPITRVSYARPRSSLASSVLAHWERVDPKRAIVLALVLSVVALTLAMPVRTYFSQRSEFEQLNASNAQLQRDVTDYQRKVNEQGDPAYVEAKARERLQLVRPGEKAVVMMFPGDDARVAAEKRAEEKARNPWYGNLWDAVATPPKTR